MRSQGLEPYKRVRDFVLINEELPKTRLGKGQDSRSRAPLSGAGRQTVRGPKKLAAEEELSPVGETVVAVLARQLDDSRIPLDDHLELDLGLIPWAWWNCWPPWNGGFSSRSGMTNSPGSLQSQTGSPLSRRKIRPRPGSPRRNPGAWGAVLMAEPAAGPAPATSAWQGGLTARLVTQGLAAIMGFWFTRMFDLKVYGRERLAGPGVHPVPQPWQLPRRLHVGLCRPRAAAPPPVFLWDTAAISTSRSVREPPEAYPGHPGGLGPESGGGHAGVGVISSGRARSWPFFPKASAPPTARWANSRRAWPSWPGNWR